MRKLMSALGLGFALSACQTTYQVPARAAVNATSKVNTYEAMPETTTEYALYEPGSINKRYLARGEKARISSALSHIEDMTGEDENAVEVALDGE
jgi:hypothetical protein